MRLRTRSNSSTKSNRSIARISNNNTSNNHIGVKEESPVIRTARLQLELVADEQNPSSALSMFGQQQLEKPHAPPPQLQLQPNAQRRLRWAVYLRSDSSSNRSSTGTASSLPNGDGLGDYANPLPLARSIVGFVDLVFPHVPATPLKYYDAAKWRRREPPVPFLAARFSEKHAARGYTTEAVRAVLMHVFTADANFHFHNSNNNASFNFNFAPAIFTGPPRVLAAFEDSNPIRADAVKILERLGFRFGARCPPCLDADGWSLYVCERTLFLDSWTCV